MITIPKYYKNKLEAGMLKDTSNGVNHGLGYVYSECCIINLIHLTIQKSDPFKAVIYF